MSTTVARLLARPGVRPAAPDPRATAAVTERFGPLPAGLVALWGAAGRVDLPALNAALLGPADVLGLVAGGWSGPADAGWVPLLDTFESNYVMIPARGPLAGRAVWTPHDGDWRVLYRHLGRLLTALADALDAGESDANMLFHDAPGDYAPDAPRSADDRAAARELLAAPHDTNEWNLAIQLLDAADLPEWERLLDTDHFVRRDAVARLGQMADPACRALLARGQADLAAFGDELSAALAAAGAAVGERRGNDLQLGGDWYMLDMFFPRRHVPDALPRMVLWVQDQLAGRDPRDRPGNVFAD